MKRLWDCRRTYLATLCIVCLTGLGYFKGMDVAMALGSVAIGVAGANAYEKKGNTFGDI